MLNEVLSRNRNFIRQTYYKKDKSAVIGCEGWIQKRILVQQSLRGPVRRTMEEKQEKGFGKTIISERGSGADEAGRKQATSSLQNRGGLEKEKGLSTNVQAIQNLDAKAQPYKDKSRVNNRLAKLKCIFDWIEFDGRY